MRGATKKFQAVLGDTQFQSTRPVRGATSRSRNQAAPISISIHAPRAGRDWVTTVFRARVAEFQSTRPVRGATPASVVGHGDRKDFNPRAPCGARRPQGKQGIQGPEDFNPRAPCGARLVLAWCWACDGHFNPRAPCGARLAVAEKAIGALKISIHAPRAGRDVVVVPKRVSLKHFNPRAPCGARRRLLDLILRYAPFQSTRPVRGATAKVYKITLHTFVTKGNS